VAARNASVYRQPQPPDEPSPQHAAFATGAQHAACSAGAQQLAASASGGAAGIAAAGRPRPGYMTSTPMCPVAAEDAGGAAIGACMVRLLPARVSGPIDAGTDLRIHS